MGQYKDISGSKFGRWTALKDSQKGPKWLCECDCGVRKYVYKKALLKGKSRSCGCYRRENPSGRTHCMSGTHPYQVWSNMLNRCRNKKVHSYKIYGGRGIKVCDKWKTFEGFWSDMKDDYFEKASLERIDPDGDYCNGNCTWIPKNKQTWNTRKTRWMTLDGKTKSLPEWSSLLEINQNTIRSRVYQHGWSDKKALTTPVKKRDQSWRYR